MQTAHSPEQLDAIAFVGQSLGPLFSQDPKQGDGAALYQAFAQVDVEAAADEWPFAARESAAGALASMKEGAGDMEGVTDEYRRLFVGPATKAAPPWGSVYTDHEGVIFGDTALDLHDWLSAHNVLVDAGDHMPDDHIGRMLELMAWIAQERPDILDDYLSLHLLTWAGHFLERVDSQTTHPFFHGLSRLASCTLDGIQAEFSLDVVKPRFFR